MWLKRKYVFYHQLLGGSCTVQVLVLALIVGFLQGTEVFSGASNLLINCPLRFSGYYQDEYSKNLRTQATAMVCVATAGLAT